MASAVRYLSPARNLPRYVQTRLISTSRTLRNEAAPNLGPTQPQKKPIGGFRGGIVGFLFGFSLASSFAAYHLLEEYQQASAALQSSVETLQLSTEKISAHMRRMEAIEKDLKALNQTSVSKDDISRVRAETKKLLDGLHVEFLDLRSHVWGIRE
ncbi:hypothetical protein L208DRAFT_1304670 [Tricholoma matsutake]|nr:hypothetical protein L208DRAFT_1304670 [Tricholoma matsutake 945]